MIKHVIHEGIGRFQVIWFIDLCGPEFTGVHDVIKHG